MNIQMVKNISSFLLFIKQNSLNSTAESITLTPLILNSTAESITLTPLIVTPLIANQEENV